MRVARYHFPRLCGDNTIGLLGGSFDPAHAGHVETTCAALRRFQLDRIWWLVSPGNPIKAKPPAPLGKQMAQAQAMMQHPQVDITDIEARLGTSKTAATLGALRCRFPSQKFVWLMGADNLQQLDRWHDWHHIMHSVPIGILARPEYRMAALNSKAARCYRGARLPDSAAGRLGQQTAPAWCFVNLPMNPQSSSALRDHGAW